MIFDWTPDGANLVCVLGSTQNRGQNDGIWIGQPGKDPWWHVPESGRIAQPEMSSVLEGVRASRPAWTNEGKRFAFPAYMPGKTKNQPGRHFLYQGTLATHQVDLWSEGEQPYRDLQWDRKADRAAPDMTVLPLE